MRNRNTGLTLTEAIVVLSVIALLAFIAVPLIGNQIEKAKIARAQKDCQTIAAAMDAFYQDVNAIPTKGADWNDYTTLLSGTSINTSAPYGFLSSDSITEAWVHGRGSPTDPATTVDLLDNHLVYNTPGGSGANAYDTTGEYAWRGPYINPGMLDPWGHPYLVNVYINPSRRVNNSPHTDTSYERRVMCAGPDGLIDSGFPPTSTHTLRHSLIRDDDIAVRWDSEPPTD